MVDGTKLPIHGETSLQLHIGALRWKPKLPVTNIKGLDFILGRDFLKRFNPEIDWINSKMCIYNNGKRIALRSWTDTGDVPETTLARFEKTVNESNTGYLALVMAAAEEEKPSSELPAAVKEVLEQYKGCSPSPLLPSVASAATADLGGFESVGAASAPSGSRRTGRSKGGRGARWGGGGGGGGGGGSGGGGGGSGSGGGGGGVGSSSGGGGGGGGGGGRGSGGAGRGVAQRSGAGGGQRQQQQRSRETPSPQQLREWYAGRQRGGGAGPCTYVLHTGDRAGEQCGGLHSTQHCFGRLTDAWRHQFPDATEIPRWGDLSRAGVAVFDLDYDAILAAMYALSTSDEGDSYLCVPPDPGIAAAALGAGETAALGASVSATPGTGESASSGTTSAQVFHTFTLDSGASRSFFQNRTTLTPLSRPVAVSLADPSGGPLLASFSTVLPCPAAPSGSLSGLYLPSFSTNLVSGADLQDQGVDQFTPAGQRVTHCTCARTGRHLATFTRQPGSSLYTLSTASPPVPASGQVAASSQVFAAASGSGPESAPCSCRLLSHQTLLWHHRLGHPLRHLSHISELGPTAHLHRFTAGQARVHVTQ
ncbi:unnamed protein product [Closterium sp. NIES-53]